MFARLLPLSLLLTASVALAQPTDEDQSDDPELDVKSAQRVTLGFDQKLGQLNSSPKHSDEAAQLIDEVVDLLRESSLNERNQRYWNQTLEKLAPIVRAFIDHPNQFARGNMRYLVSAVSSRATSSATSAINQVSPLLLSAAEERPPKEKTIRIAYLDCLQCCGGLTEDQVKRVVKLMMEYETSFRPGATILTRISSVNSHARDALLGILDRDEFFGQLLLEILYPDQLHPIVLAAIMNRGNDLPLSSPDWNDFLSFVFLLPELIEKHPAIKQRIIDTLRSENAASSARHLVLWQISQQQYLQTDAVIEHVRTLSKGVPNVNAELQEAAIETLKALKWKRIIE